MYHHEYIEKVLTLYLNGMAIDDVAELCGNASEKDIHDILDRYLPYLGET